MLSRVVQPTFSFFTPSLSKLALSTLLISGALVGCQAPETNEQALGENSVETSAATVQVSPLPEAKKVALASAIKVRFAATSAAVAEEPVLVVTVDGEPVQGHVVYSEAQRQVSFQPVQALKPNTEYTVSIAATATTEGKVWSFTTADEIGLTPQWVIDTCMTDSDIALLAAINRQRQQGAVCGETEIEPVAALEWHCDLAFLANAHAEDLVATGSVDPLGSDGSTPVERVNSAGIVWRGVAENEVLTLDNSADGLVAATLSQASQCNNLMDSRLTHVGVSDVPVPETDASVSVQLFIQL